MVSFIDGPFSHNHPQHDISSQHKCCYPQERANLNFPQDWARFNLPAFLKRGPSLSSHHSLREKIHAARIRISFFDRAIPTTGISQLPQINEALCNQEHQATFPDPRFCALIIKPNTFKKNTPKNFTTTKY